MYHTTDAHIDAYLSARGAEQAIAEREDERAIEEFGADWEVRALWGERFLSERDFAPDAEVDGPSDADWQAFLEMSWVDPAERDLG